MRSPFRTTCATLFIVLSLVLGAAGQDDETIKIDTNLVTIPVLVSNREGLYMPDLRQDEFTVEEDGVRQEVAFFATVSAPFHVVLMLDTSASTQEKLAQIQSAAVTFVEQLQPADRVKIISFDDRVQDLSDFTSDRALLGAAIRRTSPGQGTKLYDAVDLALFALRRVRGRKAIVLFTDGVDWHSDNATYEQNRRALDESGVIVYPIRYDTRRETERIARQQQQSGQVVDVGPILGGPSRGGPPVPHLPEEITLPRRTGGGGQGPLGLPGSVIITPPRRDRGGDPRDPRDRRDEGESLPGRGLPDVTGPGPSRRSDDSIDRLLDRIYRLGDEYLNELSARSGGRLLRADTLGSLPAAFAQIAAELRTQYSLGYYPANAARDGKYRKIRVRVSRKDAAVRARPGYRAPLGG